MIISSAETKQAIHNTCAYFKYAGSEENKGLLAAMTLILNQNISSTNVILGAVLRGNAMGKSHFWGVEYFWNEAFNWKAQTRGQLGYIL